MNQGGVQPAGSGLNAVATVLPDVSFLKKPDRELAKCFITLTKISSNF